MCLLFYFILFASHIILRLGNASKPSLLSLLRMGVSYGHFHRARERGGVSGLPSDAANVLGNVVLDLQSDTV